MKNVEDEILVYLKHPTTGTRAEFVQVDDDRVRTCMVFGGVQHVSGNVCVATAEREIERLRTGGYVDVP